MKIAICGAKGKMGKTFVDYFHSIHDITEIDSSGLCLNDVIEKVDLVVDFTKADAAFINAVIALTHGKPVIIGTTGLTDTQKATLKTIANKKEVGCMLASNFSIGMLWIKRNINEISKYFKDIHIIEEHHESKLDSPSGSALSLQHILKAPLENITSIRGSKQTVRHKIILKNGDETLVIEHAVNNRNAYMVQLGECIKDITRLHAYVELE